MGAQERAAADRGVGEAMYNRPVASLAARRVRQVDHPIPVRAAFDVFDGAPNRCLRAAKAARPRHSSKSTRRGTQM